MRWFVRLTQMVTLVSLAYGAPVVANTACVVTSIESLILNSSEIPSFVATSFPELESRLIPGNPIGRELARVLPQLPEVQLKEIHRDLMILDRLFHHKELWLDQAIAKFFPEIYQTLVPGDIIREVDVLRQVLRLPSEQREAVYRQMLAD